MFVTNSLSFLPQCDQIIMLDNGIITETGCYEEIKNKEGSFADFISLYLSNNETNREHISK
jgi:ATP-binding cassette subfamily C (CFTR/MRP) protein 1